MSSNYRNDPALILQNEKGKTPLKIDLPNYGVTCQICGHKKNSREHWVIREKCSKALQARIRA